MGSQSGKFFHKILKAMASGFLHEMMDCFNTGNRKCVIVFGRGAYPFCKGPKLGKATSDPYPPGSILLQFFQLSLYIFFG
jgi:hypothetical protein